MIYLDGRRDEKSSPARLPVRLGMPGLFVLWTSFFSFISLSRSINYITRRAPGRVGLLKPRGLLMPVLLPNADWLAGCSSSKMNDSVKSDTSVVSSFLSTFNPASFLAASNTPARHEEYNMRSRILDLLGQVYIKTVD